MQRRTLLSSVAASFTLTAASAHAAASFIETRDGERLYCRDAGSGRPVVLIHGWTLSSEIWKEQTDWLAAHDLRTIAYDRRGHGHSSKPDRGYDYDRLAGDLSTILEKLDLTDVVLVGHSMGSGEVVRYLARFGGQRIARVMLVAPTTPFGLKTVDNPDGTERQVYDKLIAALQGDRHAYLAAGAPGLLGRNATPQQVEWAMSIAQEASPQAQAQCIRSFAETDFRPDMRAITQPTTIIYGSADVPAMAVNARRTQAAIAGSRLEIYDGAPHALFLTHAERFNRDLLAFARS
jgi:non-heme chloroperoxidase